MERSRIDSTALLAAAIAAAIILFLTRTGFTYLTTIGGVTLLFVLFSYDREGKRSVFQSLAFSAVCGFCVMLASGIIYQISLGPKNESLDAAAKEAYYQIRLAATWGFATLILWAIDCARMSGRTAYELPAAYQRGEDVTRVAPPRAGSRHPLQLVPESTASFPAVATPPPPPPPVREPEYRRPEYREPAPVVARTPEPPPPAAPPPPPQEPTPVPVGTAPAPVAAARPAPAPLPPGKEAMIYVNLVGEGLNLLRSVRAEHLGHDFYKIVEETPEGETWEYGPGQVVRCKKQKLSSGKALVAFEEAPRSQ